MAGQAAAMVCAIEPAAEIVDEMIAEAEAVMARLGRRPSEGVAP